MIEFFMGHFSTGKARINVFRGKLPETFGATASQMKTASSYRGLVVELVAAERLRLEGVKDPVWLSLCQRLGIDPMRSLRDLGIEFFRQDLIDGLQYRGNLKPFDHIRSAG